MGKNIVILRIENGAPSGVVRYIQMLTDGVRHSGKDMCVHLICMNSLILFPSIRIENGAIIAEIPYPSKSRAIRKTFYWLTKYFEVAASLLSPYFMGKENIVWHVQELFIVELAAMLKTSVGGTVLSHLHMIPWKFHIEHNVKYFNHIYSKWKNSADPSVLKSHLEVVAYPLSDRIICVSHSGKNHILSVYGDIASDKIDVIYNGLNKIETVPSKRVNEVFEILFVGRVSREKGIMCLLEALDIVRRRGYSFRLKLAGECTASVSNLIRSTYRHIDVEILGVVAFDKLKRLYANCNVGVVPSLHEQCSYTAIEMMMFGMPMIVSDVDALSEMFEDGVNALKVPLVFDEDFGLKLDDWKFASSVIRLMEDEELRQTLSKNAIKNYEERFTLEQMIENTIDVYERL